MTLFYYFIMTRIFKALLPYSEHIICKNHNPAWLGFPKSKTRKWAVYTARDS